MDQGDPSNLGIRWIFIWTDVVLKSFPIMNCLGDESRKINDRENKMTQNFNLKKFNMDMIKERCGMDSRKSPMIVIIGKKDTGKSFLARDLLFNVQESFPAGMVISPTEAVNEYFQSFVPSKLIHDKYEPTKVQAFIKRQFAAKQRFLKSKQSGQPFDPRAFLILDDCLYAAKEWINEESTRFVFMNGRHLDMMTIITMQYPLGIPPMLRTNVDYCFILREPYVTNRKRIFDNYGSAFPSFEFFCQVMDQCTQNYECLVMNNNSQSNKLEDIVYWYKAIVRHAFLFVFHFLHH
jgi:hypothetical protein